MKILLLQLIGVGGTQLYVAQLANALSKNNDVIVLLGSHLYEERHYDKCNSKIILFDTKPSYFKMLLKVMNPMTYYYILKIINRENPDVIHLVFEDLISGITFCMLRLKGKKLIFTEHDPSFHLGETYMARFNQYIAKFIARSVANGIIVHGNQQKMILVEKGVSDQKIHIVSIGNFSYYTKWIGETSEEENTILFFGMIREYKGLNYLIEAVSKVASSIPNIKVIIAGDGDITKYADSLKDKNRFEVHNRFIPDEEVARFFQRASIVVLPYVDASQSGVVSIAYAFKKPVVVTSVGSLAEIVDNDITGLVVPPRNKDELSRAIICLLKDNELRKTIGENGYKKMNEDLSWSNIVQRTIEVYN